MLLDCGATTVYVLKRWVEEHQLQPNKVSDRCIRVNLGDNQIVEAEQEILPLEIMVSGGDDASECVAPQIDGRCRRIQGTQEKTLHWERTGEASEPIEEGGPVIASGLQRSADTKGLSAKRPDFCRGAALETDVKFVVEVVHDQLQKRSPSVVRRQQNGAPVGNKPAEEIDAERNSAMVLGRDNVVEKMLTMGVIDDGGEHTKYITRKKLRKLLRIKPKYIDDPDFMLVLSNGTIKQVVRSLQRQDQPDHVGSEKVLRYLETDWGSFRDNPAYDPLTNYKGDVFRPVLPEGLPERRTIEHRIDVKDPNLAMYRRQWRQSPAQQREIVLWVTDMVKKKLIRPSTLHQRSAFGSRLYGGSFMTAGT
ncbi:hypothetical protein PHMEG_00014591 [Phytophthora megakarya]|uniref:Uncharacterized protein n=1 Tax=Phytophthora megakarya TaxID=4795 RepID=A0A225W3Y0_9STRA|nr:hypothetical protein PHMEG_00014591 [Phytophthora megakarya]